MERLLLTSLAIIFCVAGPAPHCETVTPILAVAPQGMAECTLFGQHYAATWIEEHQGRWHVGAIKCTIGEGKREEKAT